MTTFAEHHCSTTNPPGDNGKLTGCPDLTTLRPDFLRAMRAVPAAVAIVATEQAGQRGGLAATAWTSLTADPPMLVVCVNANASAHPAILNRCAFSVNLLPVTACEVVATFSNQRRLQGDDRFANAQWSAGPNGQPFYRDALVAFECELVDRHAYGTHTILIGRVTHIDLREGGTALIYSNGAYACAGPVDHV